MQFSISEGRNLNVFFQDPFINVHVLWRSLESRLQFCFPEGNSGVAIDLAGSLALQPEVTSWGGGGALRGAQISLTVRGNLAVGATCLDSLRSLRDARHPEAHEHRRRLRETAGFVEPRWQGGREPQTLEQRTQGLTGKWTMVLRLELPEGVRAQTLNEDLTLVGTAEPWVLRVSAGHEHPALHPLGEDRLLSTQAAHWLERLQPGPARDRALVARRNLGFLVFEEKLLAGSWRFLTYFGRDTLLTSLLLGPTGSLALHTAALGSVLARLSQGGQVAHEEDIGDQATYRRLEVASGPVPTFRSGEPVYDYKMVDDDFLLLPALRAVAQHPEAGSWWPAFRREHHTALEANVRWCLGRLGRLVGLDHDTVGDWRDSHWGLGGGFYPNSVNIGLVPVFLEALAWYQGTPTEVERPAIWELAPRQFEVVLTAAQIRQRLTDYLETVPASTPDGAWLRARPLGGGVTVLDWLQGRASWPVLDTGLKFSALALDREGVPIEVINSDLSFRLFLADPPVSELESLLALLELPYPLGLAHPVGFLVANPILSGRPDLWTKLDRRGYHGAVVWSWQDAMIALGLGRQARRTDLPTDLRRRVRALREQARVQRTLAGDFVASELWSWRIVDGRAVPVAYGAEEGDETESNAIQLWSSAALALGAEPAFD